ncbi:L-serine ammonia-lyase, iron-sulfur-dependent subunit beta [Breznakiella homolactica]|uniref:L-serine dehydratase n=1 Tax=Breznakiella homolactica TaxID=2798577 RepID=A0A7T8B899_9SPIR|nr:L-serine ammonia-lyase, iron-sulfur-dependent subunit beta [Breznakiella homolactica]QQO08359.1 L-serine ammonia-lyase, iron-sulfur-dependent subunit beta [Breznakiella homolactica]
MKEIGAFDVIGPVMIGPSSSHTAGALRIALLARKMFRPEIAAVRFVLYGSFAETYQGHGTDRALIAGILGFESDDPRIPDSFALAEKAGITAEFSLDRETKDIHPNTVDICLSGKNGESMKVRGISVGGGRAEIRGIDGVDIKLAGEYSTIFIKHRDAPGVVAYIAGKLSENNINIAFMRLYRENKGEQAYTIIEADEEISSPVVSAIEEHPAVYSAILIQ